jgi:hypothetical protein
MVDMRGTTRMKKVIMLRLQDEKQVDKGDDKD